MMKSFATITPVLALAGACVLLRPMGITLSRDHRRALGVGVLIAIAIALPWHLAQVVLHGREFFKSYVLDNSVQKAISTEAANLQERLFYVRRLHAAFPGWFWLIGPALAVAVWRLWRRRSVAAMLLIVWVVLPFAFFNLAHAKLSWYLVPTYPAIAILIGAFVASAPSRPVRIAAVVACAAATVMWNARSLEPLNYMRHVRALGACIQATTRPDETMGFFDPVGRYTHSNQPVFWGVGPAARFYADRPMVGLPDRASVERWIADGGIWLWAEDPDAQIIADLFTVAGRHGPEILLQRGTTDRADVAQAGVCGL